LNSSATVEAPQHAPGWKPDLGQPAVVQPAQPAERHWRSVVKAITWRAVGTIDTMVISFLVTGKVKFALSIGFVELFTKVTLFYLHERVWHKIPYGKNQPPKE
jgi:uncharacterized membrane protein